jgi:hypothetical protein
MPDGNRWIVTTINYTTGWPVAVPKAAIDTIATFIYKLEEIYLQVETFGLKLY